jgi:predicted phage tail protein
MATVDILGPATVMITMCVTVGWIVRTVSVNRRQKAIAAAQIEAHTKLLERFGSAAEAQTYLESDAGRRFLELATVERVDPVGRVIQSIQQGLVLTMAGAAFLSGAGLMADEDARAFVSLLGYLGIFVGAGSLTSAGLSFVLLRRYGGLRSREHDS